MLRSTTVCISPRQRGYFFLLCLLLPGLVVAADPVLNSLDQQRWHALLKSAQQGLEPADYRLEELASLLAAQPPDVHRFSEMLTQVYRRYSQDLSSGRVRPENADPDWHIAAESANVPLTSSPQVLQPPHPDYQRLQRALLRYQAIARDGGWPALPAGRKLMRGMRDERVITLRNRLRISADYDQDMQADPYFFDAGIEAAVRHFQKRHGLGADGIVGEATRTALNVSVHDRITQLIVTMERWRWLPRHLEARYIWVNVANAELKVIENGRTVLAMRTIVGRPYRPTPSFRGEIKAVVFNPTWSVPVNIAVEDILPQQRNDNNFLARKKIRVFKGQVDRLREVDPSEVDWDSLGASYFPYRLRQDAGPANSLGRIKFQLDNPYDIYLHDTPMKLLFQLPERTFSSGCVRLEKPSELAAYLLKLDQGWSPSDVQSRIEALETSPVRLYDREPVYFVYLTSWVSPEGVVNFRNDIYGRDARLAKALGR